MGKGDAQDREADYIWTPAGGLQFVGSGEEPVYRTPEGYFAKPGAEYMIIPVPPPIGTGDMERWIWMMDLSEAQANFFASLYEEYAREELEFHNREVQKLWERGVEFSERQRALQFDVRLAEEIADFFRKDCARASAGLVAVEDRMFDGLIHVLTEDQVMLLEQVRRQRQRQRDNSASRFLAADCDITLLLYELHLSDYDLTPVDSQAYVDEMMAYDAAATSLFRSRFEIKSRNVNRGTVIENEFMSIITDAGGPGGMTEADWQDVDVARKRLARVNRQTYEAERRVHELNERSIGTIAALLPDETGKELIHRFELLAYRFLYPDLTDPHELFEAVADIETLSSEQRASIDAFISLSSDAHSRISAEIRERYVEWHRQLAMKWQKDPAEEALYVRKMDELQASRVKAVRMAADHIRVVLTPDQFASVEKTFIAFDRGVSSIDFMPAGYGTQLAREWYERNKDRMAGIGRSD